MNRLLSRARHAKTQKLEGAMHLWLSDRSGSNAASNDQMFIEKTNELGVKLNETDFSYSRGWLSRLKFRCHVAKHVYEGEVARVDDTAVAEGR